MLPVHAIDEGFLRDIVNRIVAAVHPRRIILFGSGARGQMGPHSDLDLLVIMPDGVHRRHSAETIYDCLYGLTQATDIAVVTESDVEMFGNNTSLVLYPALREGRELYRAES